MKILVISSCTARKGTETTTAGELYQGEQHKRIMAGVGAARAGGVDVTLAIVSAGAGLVAESDRIAPYDRAFSGKARSVIRQEAEQLGIPDAFRELVAQQWDQIIVALGDDYLEAVAWSEQLALGGPATLLCSGTVAKGQHPEGVRTIGVDNSVAKRERCGLIGLKGKLAAEIMQQLVAA